jgi:phosphoribosylglycinamide formyltransferase-1
VHFVVPEVDAGPVIAQKAVEVLEGDDEEALSERILKEEHRLLPRAVQLFADGRLKMDGRRVVVS